MSQVPGAFSPISGLGVTARDASLSAVKDVGLAGTAVASVGGVPMSARLQLAAGRHFAIALSTQENVRVGDMITALLPGGVSSALPTAVLDFVQSIK